MTRPVYALISGFGIFDDLFEDQMRIAFIEQLPPGLQMRESRS